MVKLDSVLESRMRTSAQKSFVANMAKPSFVVQLLSGAGVQRPPCQFCWKQKNKTCSNTVGEIGCEEFIPYTSSSAKLESKVLEFIASVHQHNAHLRQENQQHELAA